MKLTVVNLPEEIDESVLEEVAEAAFSCFNEQEGEIELNFISEAEIADLNQKYRKIDAPTDVLSFQLEKEPLIGQVFICYTIAKKQAESLNNPIANEASLLLVHGILHIYGFDHVSEKEAEEMEETERKILKKVGFER